MNKTLYTLFTSYIISICVLIFAFKQNDSHCPSDRILVKTLTDSLAGDINFFPARTDVQEFRKITVPSKLEPNSKRIGKEFNTYQLNCYITSYTLTENGDYRLTIQGFDDSSAVSVAQIINPGCEQAKKSKYIHEFQTSYETFSQYALLNNKVPKGVYKIIGVLLYESSTKKDGTQSVSTTIHPVINLTKFK